MHRQMRETLLRLTARVNVVQNADPFGLAIWDCCAILAL
jgi:hypothetical protein